MGVQVFLILIAVAILFFVTIRLYHLDSESRLYRSVMLLCVSAIILGYCEHEFLRITNIEETWLLEKIYYIFLFNIAMSPVLAWYFARLEDSEHYGKYHNFFLIFNFSFVALLFVLQVFTPWKFLELVPADPAGYGFNYLSGFSYWLWMIWIVLVNIQAFVFYLYAFLSSKPGRDRFWKRIILFVVIFMIVNIYTINVILPLMGVTVSLFSVPFISMVGLFFGWTFSDFKLFEISKDNAIQHIVDSMSNLMVLTDKELTVKEVNNVVEEMSLSRQEVLVGQSADKVLGVSPSELQKMVEEIEGTDAKRIFKEVEAHFDGRKVYLLLTLTPIENKSNKKTGYVFIGNDMTDYKATQAQLIKSNEELKTSNKELEQFAFVSSHDLQEPLRMVGNFVQLLEEEYGDKIDDDGKTYIKYAVDGVSRMSQLIHDLLDFSRIGKKLIERKDIDFLKLLKEMRVDLHPAFRDKGADLEYGDIPRKINGDQGLLRIVFQNLISNGIKFNKSDMPKVKLSGKETDEGWLFSVEDNGIGIQQAENKEKVFEIFKRLNRKEEFKGTGIGLAICQKAVAMHGGKIWFESTPGEGTTFFFTIAK